MINAAHSTKLHSVTSQKSKISDEYFLSSERLPLCGSSCRERHSNTILHERLPSWASGHLVKPSTSLY
jgi:hypothetical protein